MYLYLCSLVCNPVLGWTTLMKEMVVYCSNCGNVETKLGEDAHYEFEYFGYVNKRFRCNKCVVDAKHILQEADKYPQVYT